MIKKLSKLSENNRAVLYVVAILFVVCSFSVATVCGGLRFEYKSGEQCLWILCSAIVIAVVTWVTMLLIYKLEEKIALR